MKENEQQEEGPILSFEPFEVLPSGRGKTGNLHVDRAIEKILKMEAKTKLPISSIDAERWGLTYANIRGRLIKAEQLGRFTFRTVRDGNGDKIGFEIYCVA